MHNLFRLGSLASLEGYFYKPRMDRELLNTYTKGLIATTGCPSGEVQTYLRLGKYDEAVASAAEFRDIFGRDNYYVELMEHGLSLESRVRSDLLRLARTCSCRWSPPTTCTTPQRGGRRGARGAALRADRRHHGRRQPVQARGRAATT